MTVTFGDVETLTSRVLRDSCWYSVPSFISGNRGSVGYGLLSLSTLAAVIAFVVKSSTSTDASAQAENSANATAMYNFRWDVFFIIFYS